jgi:hypothetical protein
MGHFHEFLECGFTAAVVVVTAIALSTIFIDLTGLEASA